MNRARIESRTNRATARTAAAVRHAGGYATGDARLEPVHMLRRLAAERAQLDDRVRVTVQELRQAGASWTVIGDALGVTRSAAQKRYGADELPLS